MDKTSAEYAKMAEYVDALIAKKYPGRPLEAYQDLREETIKSLDSYIDSAVVDSLNPTQLADFDQLLDREDADESVFQNFFAKSGIDFNECVQNAMVNFGREFLGGTNE
ncbi:hypothetical protein IJ135_02020 [Candidatus Saccharibacteria bacterium]|nr:hypothetical protein [Candidatus Saccharibacteria bacterium]